MTPARTKSFWLRLSAWLQRVRPGVAQTPDWQRYTPELQAVRRCEREFDSLSDSEITERAIRLRGTDPPIAEAFGLAIQALRRTLAIAAVRRANRGRPRHERWRDRGDADRRG